MRPALAAGVLAGLLLGSGAVAAEEILERDWLQKDRELFEALWRVAMSDQESADLIRERAGRLLKEAEGNGSSA